MNELAIFYICVIALLVTLLANRPYEILRPSMMFAFIMTILLNIAAAFLDPEIHVDYSKIRELRLLSILFPLGVIIWVMLTPGITRVACHLLKRCKDSGHEPGLNNSSIAFHN